MDQATPASQTNKLNSKLLLYMKILKKQYHFLMIAINKESSS